MTKNLLICSLFLLSVSSVLGVVRDACFCPLVYFPVCATNGHEFATFSNQCFGHCANYTMVYAGDCKANNTISSPDCIAHCGNNLSWVCAQKDNETFTVPNTCVAQCLGLEIVKNGTCSGRRVLGIVPSWIKEKANKAIDSIKNGVKDLANKTKEGFKDFVEDVKEAANKTKEAIKDAANKTEEALKKAGEKIKDTFNKVVDILKQRIRKIGEAFENCTCHIVDKIEDAVSKKFDEWEAKAKLEAEKIKNKTKAFWDQTRDGFIAAEEKVAGWFEKTAESIKNKTILIWVKSRDAIRKEADWFKKLLKCNNCTNEYKPVCIHTDNGDEATMLNECWAHCGDLEIMYPKECLRVNDQSEGEALVVEHVEL